MSNPKEKAEELVEKFYNEVRYYQRAKQCALIAVDEIIENCPFKDYGFSFDSISSRLDAIENYWQEVKQELEKI